MNNPVGLQGIEFTEFASPKPEQLHQLFCEFGFSRTHRHKSLNIDFYKQNDIHFFLNKAASSFAAQFTQSHGPSVCSMGWRVEDAQKALKIAVERGAKPCPKGDLVDEKGQSIPAIFGIGDSLIYFIDQWSSPGLYSKLGFVPHESVVMNEEKGFLNIDHLTNNVYQGTMEHWSNFYKNVFGFTEVRYFDIRGAKTGLTSYALKSPCGSFCIPINEGTEKKSQINEYLEEYKGPGVQHIAFSTNDILSSLKKLQGSKIETLDIDDEYYKEIFTKFPQITEDKKEIQDFNVLVDGDEEGYLLQIFTKNIIGPIFIEIIQRKNHYSFGEGNFGALFRSIERDQQKRGYLE
ncbi:MAG: 4-hydroxyphenylpyruvate dioxygenase [Pseudomonadota bacterium]|jgi:4-hydroxyphenylpyruvate dioxygenase